MTRLTAAVILVLAAAAHADGPPGQAPPRWWGYWAGQFDQALRSFELRARPNAARRQRAADLTAAARARAAEYVESRRAEIDALAADYSAQRQRLRTGDTPTPGERAALQTRSDRLYAPVAALLGELDRGLRAVETDPALADQPPPASQPAPAEPPAEDDGPWAGAAQIEAMIRRLPPRPGADEPGRMLAARLAAGSVAEARLAVLREKAERAAAELRRLESDSAAETRRLSAVLAILQRRPRSVLAADLPVFERHWQDLIAPAAAVLDDFRRALDGG